MRTDFIEWAKKHKWKIETTENVTTLPDTITSRYSIPAQWLDFIQNLQICENASGIHLNWKACRMPQMMKKKSTSQPSGIHICRSFFPLTGSIPILQSTQQTAGSYPVMSRNMKKYLSLRRILIRF